VGEVVHAPGDGIAEHALGAVVGGLHAFFRDAQPKAFHLVQETAGKHPGFVLPVAVFGQKRFEARDECAPFAQGRRLVAPSDEARQLHHEARSEVGQLGVFEFGQPPGPAEQVGQAGLALVDPLFVQRVVALI